MPPTSGPSSLFPSNARNASANANANQNERSPSEHGGEVELRFSDFKHGISPIYNDSRAHHVIFSFDCIKHNMDKQLAMELAEFLPKAWEQSLLSMAPSLTDHEFYKKLRGTEHNQKQLYYPYWFFLAAVWGTAHPSLAPIRVDMEALWGFSFQSNYVIFPPNIPAERQRVLFHGGKENTSPLGEIQRRAQDFKAAIEGAGNPSVIEAVKEYAPALLNKAAHTDDMESLHRKLKNTHEQLQKTQGQLKETQKRLQETNDELQKTRKKLKNDTENSNKDLAAVNRRVDKVVDTCALVLSILTTPGGEKRKLEAEHDGA